MVCGKLLSSKHDWHSAQICHCQWIDRWIERHICKTNFIGLQCTLIITQEFSKRLRVKSSSSPNDLIHGNGHNMKVYKIMADENVINTMQLISQVELAIRSNCLVNWYNETECRVCYT